MFLHNIVEGQVLENCLFDFNLKVRFKIIKLR